MALIFKSIIIVTKGHTFWEFFFKIYTIQFWKNYQNGNYLQSEMKNNIFSKTIFFEMLN